MLLVFLILWLISDLGQPQSLSNEAFEALVKSLSFPNETRFGECLPDATTSTPATVVTTSLFFPTTSSTLSSSSTAGTMEESTTESTTGPSTPSPFSTDSLPSSTPTESVATIELINTTKEVSSSAVSSTTEAFVTMETATEISSTEASTTEADSSTVSSTMATTFTTDGETSFSSSETSTPDSTSTFDDTKEKETVVTVAGAETSSSFELTAVSSTTSQEVSTSIDGSSSGASSTRLSTEDMETISTEEIVATVAESSTVMEVGTTVRKETSSMSSTLFTTTGEETIGLFESSVASSAAETTTSEEPTIPPLSSIPSALIEIIHTKMGGPAPAPSRTVKKSSVVKSPREDLPTLLSFMEIKEDSGSTSSRTTSIEQSLVPEEVTMEKAVEASQMETEFIPTRTSPSSVSSDRPTEDTTMADVGFESTAETSKASIPSTTLFDSLADSSSSKSDTSIVPPLLFSSSTGIERTIPIEFLAGKVREKHAERIFTSVPSSTDPPGNTVTISSEETTSGRMSTSTPAVIAQPGHSSSFAIPERTAGHTAPSTAEMGPSTTSESLLTTVDPISTTTESFTSTDEEDSLATITSSGGTTADGQPAPVSSNGLQGPFTAPVMIKQIFYGSTPASRARQQPTTRSYGLACLERCPEWSLPGSDGCYVMAPPFYSKSYERSLSWCMRNKTGHMVEADELLADYQLIKEWIDGMELLNSSVYISRVPFLQIAYKSYGQHVDLGTINAPLKLDLQPIDLVGSFYYRGICKTPQYCGIYNCTLDALYDSLPGQLPLPMGSAVPSGDTLRLQCNSPSVTSLSLKCDSFGKLFPRPGSPSCKVPHSFKAETPTPGNKALREHCDCNPRGAESCHRVGEHFQCQCKANWTKNTCWKSPDMCWVPVEAPDKCGDHGSCVSFVDYFTCSCAYGYGGESCEYDLTNVTWFGGGESVALATPGIVMTVVLLIPEGIWLGLKAKLSPSLSTTTNDPLEYTHNWRKLTVGMSGAMAVIYSAPSWLESGPVGCRIAFGVIFTLMMIGHWLVLMEAYFVFCFYSGIGRNRWGWEVEERDPHSWWRVKKTQRRWYLTKEFICGAGVVGCILLQFFFGFLFYDEMVAPHTCTGQIVQLNNTVTALNMSILAALAYLSTGLGLLIQVHPGKLAEQRRYFEVYKGGEGIENMDKVLRSEYQQLFQGPVIFCTFFIQIWSQDRVAYDPNEDMVGRLAFILTILGLLLSLWNIIVFWPRAYGWIMKKYYPSAPWLPFWTPFTPFASGYLSPEEIINLKNPEATLPCNEEWPLRPEDEHYVSAERRHQCQRKMTRDYLEWKLKGIEKCQAMDMIAEMFLLEMEEGDEERRQWLIVLSKWLQDIEKYDKIEIKIHRDKSRMEHLYRLMGHYPAEPAFWWEFGAGGQKGRKSASTAGWQGEDQFSELILFPAAERYLKGNFDIQLAKLKAIRVSQKNTKDKKPEDLLSQRIGEIKAKIDRRRMIPQLMKSGSRVEWMAEDHGIPRRIPKASEVVGMNSQLRDPSSMPPLILEKKITGLLYRW